jgi:hypothetical protein
VVVASLDDLGRDGVSVAIARIGTVNRVAPHGPRSASLGERAAKGEHGGEVRGLSGDRQLAEGRRLPQLFTLVRSLLFDSHTESRMDTRFIIRYY